MILDLNRALRALQASSAEVLDASLDPDILAALQALAMLAPGTHAARLVWTLAERIRIYQTASKAVTRAAVADTHPIDRKVHHA